MPHRVVFQLCQVILRWSHATPRWAKSWVSEKLRSSPQGCDAPTGTVQEGCTNLERLRQRQCLTISTTGAACVMKRRASGPTRKTQRKRVQSRRETLERADTALCVGVDVEVWSQPQTVSDALTSPTRQKDTPRTLEHSTAQHITHNGATYIRSYMDAYICDSTHVHQLKDVFVYSGIYIYLEIFKNLKIDI